MKQLFILVVLVVFPWAGANAVDFNKDALKAMQQEGHKIVEESQAGKPFKAGGGFCLDMAGDGLVLRKCDADAASQKWRFDDQSRLVTHNGKCLAGAKVQNCGAGNLQKWNHDGKKRLANAAGQCLQVQGDTPKGGAKVVTAACGDASGQVWQ